MVSSFKFMRISGVTLAIFVILVALTTEGYYAWKVYELTNICPADSTTGVPDPTAGQVSATATILTEDSTASTKSVNDTSLSSSNPSILYESFASFGFYISDDSTSTYSSTDIYDISSNINHVNDDSLSSNPNSTSETSMNTSTSMSTSTGTPRTPATENPGDPNAFCYENILELRSYIGLAEGIVGFIVAVGLCFGFYAGHMSFVWLWVIWAVGITSYNAFCVADYSQRILVEAGGTEFPWEDVDSYAYTYGIFFIVVMTTVIAHGLALLCIVPIATTYSYQLMKGNIATSKIYSWENDAFEMD